MSFPTSGMKIFLANELGGNATIVEPQEQLHTQTTPQYVLHIYDSFKASSANAQAPEPSQLYDNKMKLYDIKAQCWQPSLLPHSLRQHAPAGSDGRRGKGSRQNRTTQPSESRLPAGKRNKKQHRIARTIKGSNAREVIETEEGTDLPIAGPEENNVATWLNRITTALRSFAPSSSSGIQTRAAKMQTLVDTLRVWSEFTWERASWRPDVVLLKKDPFDPNGSNSWRHVVSFLELTSSEDFSPMSERLARKAYAIFVSQPGRRYVVALSISNMNFRFHLFDRAGAVHSRAHSIHRCAGFFVRILYTLAFAPEECIGYDPTLFFSPVIARSTSLRIPATIQVGNDTFIIIKLLFTSDTICGRGTLCFHVKDPATSKEYVVKTSWNCDGEATTEEQMLVRIKEKGLKYGVLILVKAWTVLIDGVDDSTALRRTNYLQHHLTDDQQPKVRIHRRLLLERVGMPIEDFSCIQELISVLIDIVDVHEQLVTLCHILHRDISVKNLMMYVPVENDPECKWPISSSDPKLCARLREREEVLQRRKYRRGLLIDFDHAKFMDEESEAVPGEVGKGTVPFMAIDILSTYGSAVRETPTTTVSHEPKHDLESIVYVLIWICVLYPGPNMDPIPIQETCLKPWVTGQTPRAIEGLASLKLGQAINAEYHIKNFTPYFNGLAPYVARMYKAILLNTHYSVSFRGNPLSYDGLRDILLDAFFDVQEPKSELPAEPAGGQPGDTVRAKPKPKRGGVSSRVRQIDLVNDEIVAGAWRECVDQ